MEGEEDEIARVAERKSQKEATIQQRQQLLDEQEEKIALTEKKFLDEEAHLMAKHSALEEVEQYQRRKEEELREHRVFLEDKEAKLRVQEMQHQAREEQQNDRERALEELATKHQEKQERLDEKEQTLTDKERQLEATESEQNERETKLTEERAALTEKEEQTRQHEEDLQQREVDLSKEKEHVKEQQAKAEEEEQRLQEWDQQNQEKEENLKQTEEKLEEQKGKLEEEETRLNDRETTLNEQESAQNERNEKLDEKENALTDKEKALDEENERLVQKDGELQEKESTLAEKEEDLQQTKTRLEEEEEQLRERENAVEEQEKKHEEWETRNRETEDRLNTRAQELDELEEQHRVWEIKSREEKEMIAERQKALQELEEMLKDWEKRTQEEEDKLKEEEQKIKAEEEKLQEREKQIEEEEERQKKWKEDLEEEDARQKEREKKLEEEEVRHNEWRETLEKEAEKHKEIEQQLMEKEEKHKEAEQKLSQQQEEHKEAERKLTEQEEKHKEAERKLSDQQKKRERKISEGEDDWEVCSSNSRFKIRTVKPPKGGVDKAVNTGPMRREPYHRRARSMSPRVRTGSTGDYPGSDPNSLASVLTEDDVIMVSSFKGEKGTIVETYDIVYLREEIFDSARESVSTHGIPKPGKGLQKSHESESYVLSPEETGRGSATPRSSSTSRSMCSQRDAFSCASAESHVSVETQTNGLGSAPGKTFPPLAPDQEPESGPCETSPSVTPDNALLITQGNVKKSVSFQEESDRSYSRSPPPSTERQTCTFPPIIFSKEARSADSVHEDMLLNETMQTDTVTARETRPTPRDTDLEASESKEHGHIETSLPPDPLVSHAERKISPVPLGLALETSPNVSFLEPLTEQQEDREKEDRQVETKMQEAISAELEVITRKRGQPSRTARKMPKKDDGYSLERTDLTSTSEESSESYEPSPDISIDCVSPEMAKMLPNWLTTTPDQGPNDIIIDVTREPVKKTSPSLLGSDATYSMKTMERTSPVQGAVDEASKAQDRWMCAEEEANNQEKVPISDDISPDQEPESALGETSPSVTSDKTLQIPVQLSEMKADSSATGEKLVEVLEPSKQVLSPSPRNQEKSLPAEKHTEPDQRSVSKSMTPSDCLERQFEDQRLSDSVSPSSPPYKVSPDSPPPQRRSSPSHGAKQASQSPASITSTPPNSLRDSPLPYEILCKTPSRSPSPSSRFQGKKTPSFPSPIETDLKRKKSGSTVSRTSQPSRSSTASPKSPLKADVAHLQFEKTSPVPETKSQSQTLLSPLQKQLPSGPEPDSMSPKRSSLKSSTESSPGVKLESSPSTVKSSTKSSPGVKMESSPSTLKSSTKSSPRLKLESSPLISPESAPVHRHTSSSVPSPRALHVQLKSPPSPLPANQNIPPFLTNLVQTLEKVQVESMDTLQSGLSRISSPTKSRNVSPTTAPDSRHSTPQSEPMSPSMGTHSLHSLSAESPSSPQEQCKSVFEEHGTEQSASPAMTKPRSPSPVHVSSTLHSPLSFFDMDVSVQRHLQPAVSSPVKLTSPPSSFPSSDAGKNRSRSPPQGSEKSSLSESSCLGRDKNLEVYSSRISTKSLSPKSPSGFHTEIQSVQSPSVVSSHSSAISKSPLGRDKTPEVCSSRGSTKSLSPKSPSGFHTEIQSVQSPSVVSYHSSAISKSPLGRDKTPEVCSSRGSTKSLSPKSPSGFHTEIKSVQSPSVTSPPSSFPTSDARKNRSRSPPQRSEKSSLSESSCLGRDKTPEVYSSRISTTKSLPPKSSSDFHMEIQSVQSPSVVSPRSSAVSESPSPGRDKTPEVCSSRGSTKSLSPKSPPGFQTEIKSVQSPSVASPRSSTVSKSPLGRDKTPEVCSSRGSTKSLSPKSPSGFHTEIQSVQSPSVVSPRSSAVSKSPPVRDKTPEVCSSRGSTKSLSPKSLSGFHTEIKSVQSPSVVSPRSSAVSKSPLGRDKTPEVCSSRGSTKSLSPKSPSGFHAEIQSLHSPSVVSPRSSVVSKSPSLGRDKTPEAYSLQRSVKSLSPKSPSDFHKEIQSPSVVSPHLSAAQAKPSSPLPARSVHSPLLTSKSPQASLEPSESTHSPALLSPSARSASKSPHESLVESNAPLATTQMLTFPAKRSQYSPFSDLLGPVQVSLKSELSPEQVKSKSPTRHTQSPKVILVPAKHPPLVPDVPEASASPSAKELTESSTFAKLSVPVPSQHTLQTSPGTKQFRTAHTSSESPSPVIKMTVTPEIEQKIEVLPTRVDHSQRKVSPSSTVGSPKSKLQSLVAHFEQCANEASCQQTPTSPVFPSTRQSQKTVVHSDEIQKSPVLSSAKNKAPADQCERDNIKKNSSPSSQPKTAVESPTLLLSKQNKSQTSPPRKGSADLVSPRTPTALDNLMKQEANTSFKATAMKNSTKPSPTHLNVSPASVISQISNRGLSPGPRTRSTGYSSPVPDRSIAGMLAAQRRKVASPRTSLQGKMASVNKLTGLQSRIGVPLPTAEHEETASQQDSTERSLSEIIASLDVPASSSHTSVSQASSPSLCRTGMARISSTDLSSTGTTQQGRRSVSPNKGLITTALKTNGSDNLRNMLARQRKARQEKEKGKLPATNLSHSIKSKETGLSIVKAEVEGPELPQEHVTTSVYQKRVDREGQPPSSVVTITQKKVRYSKERLTDEHCSDMIQSPPRLSSVPVLTQGSVHQPTAMFSGKAESGKRTPVQDNVGPVRTEGRINSKRPVSETAKAKSPSKPPSPVPKLGLIRIMMDTDTQQKHEGEPADEKHPFAKARISQTKTSKERQHSAPSHSSEQRSPALSGKSSVTSEKSAHQRQSYGESSNQTYMSGISSSPNVRGSQHVNPSVGLKTGQMEEREALLRRCAQAKTGQMEERETLLRRRAQAKKLDETRKGVRKHLQGMAGDSDDSDFSDFFREYQTECQKKGVSQEQSQVQRAVKQNVDGYSAEPEQPVSRKEYPAPTLTSPPVKRRALDAHDGFNAVDPNKQGHSHQSTGPSNTCNSSPVKRSKKYEMNRFLAYPTSPPTRTSPGALRNQQELPMATGGVNRSGGFPFSVAAARDRTSVPVPLSPQLQSYRHQQGVVGDSVEMVEDLARPGRSGEFHFQQQSPFSDREKRRKHGRRVSWNDSQSSSMTDLSHNQNAALDSENDAAELGYTVPKFDNIQLCKMIDAPSLHSNIQHGRTLKMDKEDKIVARSSEDREHRKDERKIISIQPRLANFQFPSSRMSDFRQTVQHSQEASDSQYTVSQFFTDHSEINTDSSLAKHGRERSFPNSVQFSREHTKSTEYRPIGDAPISFAKEEETQRKEFTSMSNTASINLAHKHSRRKSYTMQSQHQRAVITEERQQTREYILRKNPHTARFPEHHQYRRAAIQPMKMITPGVNKAQPDQATSETHKMNLVESSQYEENLLQYDSLGATNNNNLSLCEELRNAGFSPGEMRRPEELGDHFVEGDSVDMMDYADMDRWIDINVDPFVYQYSRSHILDMNESANSSAVAGHDDTSSPEEKVFFTPQVVMGDREERDSVSCTHLSGSPDIEYTGHETQDYHCYTFPESEQRDGINSTNYPQPSNLDGRCSTLYLSVPNTESASLSVETSPSCSRPRRRYFKSCNDNKNNSGDDHPKFPSQSNISREEGYCVYGNALEPSACGGGDQGETTEQKPPEETHYSRQDYQVTSRHKTTKFRRRRSFGRSYLSRLLTKRNYSKNVSHDVSDNCALGQASLQDCNGAVCCQCSEACSVQGVDSVEGLCSDCDHRDTEPKYCLCLGEAASCQHTPYDDEDPGDEEGEVVDNCQNRCQECGCSVDFNSTYALEDQRLIPRAVTRQWQSPVQSKPCESPDCVAMALKNETDNRFRSCQPSEAEVHCAGESLLSASSDACRCGQSYCPGRGDGDVLPATRKEEQNYNVSRCQWEEQRQRANYVFKHSHEHREQEKDNQKEKRRFQSKQPEEKCVQDLGEDGAGKYTYCSHAHHLRQHVEDDHSVQSKSLAIHSMPAEPQEAPAISSPKDCQLSVTESMVQAYGYNPLTQSPFSARGYPSLAVDTSTLDHIPLPFVKRKALVFLRTDKEEFVEVGRGTYGCVYLAQATTRRGTAKVVVKDFFTDSTSWDLIVHEARMLCYLQDTGVIPHFYGLLKRRYQEDYFSLIQQYFAQGRTLHTVLVNKEQLPAKAWQDVAWQLARGLFLIHERHVLLNDLKGDNVLIDLRRERKVIKYIDLGMATYRKGLNFRLPEDQMSKFNFLSPEVRAGAYTSPMSDVYSLGYLLDQINRLAHLHLLKEVSSRCMDELPVDRPHLVDVVDVLNPDSDDH
ncbi:uncharacterized protein LOC143287709 [Babylonia areolata]|uniref:uncharacterized protein LOC143287709 n=1 Tax=Babylonia areolata TaxID=304850 RepID=UPI003FD6453F